MCEAAVAGKLHAGHKQGGSTEVASILIGSTPQWPGSGNSGAAHMCRFLRICNKGDGSLFFRAQCMATEQMLLHCGSTRNWNRGRDLQVESCRRVILPARTAAAGIAIGQHL